MLETFIYKHYKYARRAGERYGINPAFLLAQAYKETGGDSYGLRVRKNVGSLVAAGKPNRYWNGASDYSEASDRLFRVYETLQNGWYDYARLLKEKYGMDTAGNITEYANRIAYSPYIVDSDGRENYRVGIISIYRRLKPLIPAQKYVPVMVVVIVVGVLMYLAYRYRKSVIKWVR